MKSLILSLVAVSCVSCSTVGLIQKTDDENKFVILVHSNIFSNADKMEKVFNKKAMKACKGNKYKYVGEDGAEIVDIKTYGKNATSTSVLKTNRTVVCIK